MFFELLQHYANAKVIHFFNIILTKDDFFSFQMLFFSKNAKTGRFSIHLQADYLTFQRCLVNSSEMSSGGYKHRAGGMESQHCYDAAYYK